ncbi:hypothetical protein A3D62_02270 [Candidatus Kaiserbacteria bacterium RIFCSPHIGHO2_02_FULL_49_11]|uniref:N-acetyltransferase domain-containing protein n=1 Tax=Candidatus Kaiserbacteria bacterium RIFCSPHIGHO2_02_FULL_49_11 TaxID=1798489 RepID=A0A1F6D1P6_9BACT|nr:MAG: hypothetical protein A3D62_02270 [Candidatus Kaiserbacteria bacterium RIFCSPHIGHO2_02_FULL_49_11]
MSFEKFNIDVQKESENDSKEKSVNPVEVTEKELQNLLQFVEPFFQTESDPNQIPTTTEAYRKILSLDPHSVALRADQSGRIVSYAAVLPTTNELMNKFLNHEITEREMFEATQLQAIPESLYLMAIAVAKDFKGKGDVFGMMRDIITHFKDRNQDLKLFVWEFSEEGKRFVSLLEKRYDLSINKY